MIFSKEKLEESFPQLKILSENKQHEKFGILKTMAVDRNHRHNGIGNKLFQDALINLQKNNVTKVIGIEWKQTPSKITIEKFLLENNFVLEFEIKEFWKKDSIQKNYMCPVCGNPCLCTAQIYSKKIEPL